MHTGWLWRRGGALGWKMFEEGVLKSIGESFACFEAMEGFYSIHLFSDAVEKEILYPAPS